VRSVGIVGGGTMGRGIAIAFADADFAVSLMEISAEKAQAAVTAITTEYIRLAERGRLTSAQAQARSARIAAISAPEELRGCDLVIEAVFEDMTIKLQTAAQLGRHCRPGAVIASNTSTLDIDRLAQASGRPQDFVGLHFFSPANIMRLVEVIRGRETSDAALATAIAVARAIGKVPVVSGVFWGFIGNRMLEAYLRETEALLLEGASPSQIDRALENFGMAMGPCRMMDLAGVDVVAKVVAARALEGTLPKDPLYRIVARHLAELGRHGQKSGEGFYRYDGRKAIDDHDASSLIESLARRLGTARRSDIGEREIVERCILPLINEGYRILEEGVASRASDIDVVWLTGYGFPEALGGPMFHGARLGVGTLVERLHHYALTLGNAWGYWTPAASLRRSDATDNQPQNPEVAT